jgi:CHAD domain-containing protein
MGSEIIRIREIKPVLSEYISRSRELLKRSAVPDDEAIHDIRVYMKKSRAVLRLTGPLMSDSLSDRDLQSLKRVGQLMCHWRDTSVHRKTLRELRKKHHNIFSKITTNEKISRLMSKQEAMPEPDDEMKKNIAEIDELLSKTYFRLRFNQMQKIETSGLILQLELTFEEVRNIYLECRNRAKPEKMHEFRKRSKDFLYQLYFFRPMNPSRIKSVEKRLERMTLNLGKYNDLYQLLNTLGYVYPNELSLPALDELVIKIREEQDNYLSKVWPEAYRIFCPGKSLTDLLGLKQQK